ncbi:MAG: MarR family transcriptional regulator [Actinomycetota bacterium]
MKKDDQELRLAIQRLARRIRSMQADEPVTEGQRAVLFALSMNGPLSLRSLSEHERVTPPSMSRTINALIELGLVTRQSATDDARKVSLDLSPSGADFIDETRRRRDAWFTMRMNSLPTDQRRLLLEVAPILRDLADS